MSWDTSTTQEPATLTLANEFALVQIRVLHTRNGDRLEIRSPRLGTAVRLCPLEAESLTWQAPEVFSRLLVAPLGRQSQP